MDWPLLPLDAWRGTYETLHRWLQVVGKVQLALTPRTNHFWNVAFRVGARGLETPAIPVPAGDGTFAMLADFLAHTLVIRTSGGTDRTLALRPRTVAAFHRELLQALGSLGIRAEIRDQPVELLTEAIPFPADEVHGDYDARAVERWWSVVSSSAQVFERFRAGFLGKTSPVQFYWGSFDLAVSRYSGRRAPARHGANSIEAEAYSHEVSSVGFWPGDVRYPAPAYFAYTFPKPPRFEDALVQPDAAFWDDTLGEFLLPYDAVRTAPSPADALLAFCRSAYETGADLAGWDRPALERGLAPEAPSSDTTTPAQPPEQVGA